MAFRSCFYFLEAGVEHIVEDSRVAMAKVNKASHRPDDNGGRLSLEWRNAVHQSFPTTATTIRNTNPRIKSTF